MTPEDVIKMSLTEFKKLFGFAPRDALEKKWFAINAKRLDEVNRAAIEAGILGDFDLTKVNMEF